MRQQDYTVRDIGKLNFTSNVVVTSYLYYYVYSYSHCDTLSCVWSKRCCTTMRLNFDTIQNIIEFAYATLPWYKKTFFHWFSLYRTTYTNARIYTYIYCKYIYFILTYNDDALRGVYLFFYLLFFLRIVWTFLKGLLEKEWTKQKTSF